MCKRRSSPESPIAGLPLALLLGILLLLLSYLRLAGMLGTAAFQMPRLVTQTLTEPLWETRLGFNIVAFALVQLGMHLLFGAGCWLMAVASQRAWPNAMRSRRQWVFVWFLAATIWLLIANASRFPRSALGEPYQAVGGMAVAGTSLYILIAICVAGAALVTVLVALSRTFATRTLAALGGGLAAIVVGTGFLAREHVAHPGAGGKPNIFVLGIDSLRPDMTTPDNTPHMRAFLDESVRFNDAITPLARTFPSWVSILTGRHPHTTGAFMNLLPPENIRTGRTLPAHLREHGYRTIYAIDEVRFSNIDTSYGFDEAVTPVIGGSDFVLAWFADTPLSNLLMNTRLGALLYPFQHANRAAYISYDPDSFVHQVEREIDAGQPLFMALHLTLPHWPFMWADSGLPPPGSDKTQWQYISSVQRADRQLGDLLAILKRKGLLDNAIVVALSDHGEAFGADDGFLAAGLPDEDPVALAPQQRGHGTSVFSPPQFRTVLGIRGYGAAAALLPPPRTVTEPVSLVDVVPTVLDLLQLPANDGFDGESLLPLMRANPGAAAHFNERIRFTESEYNPTGFDFQKMTPSAVAHAAMVYQVDPETDRLKVRGHMIDVILSTRQYAALLGDTLAAAVPDDDGYRFVQVPLHTPSGNAQADPAQAERMRAALEQRFGIRFSPGGAGPQ